MPTKTSECERWLVGLGVGGEHVSGRWDAAGAPASSSLSDDAITTTVGAGYRWNRRFTAGLSLPLRTQHKAAGGTGEWATGPGDARLLSWWKPWEEPARAPALELGAGARLPTGRDWTESNSALLTDVTGLPGVSALLSAGATRTMGRWPWSLSLDADLPVGSRSPVQVGASLVGGRYLGTRWTALASLQEVLTFAGGARTRRTAVGARLVTGQRLRWRAWAGVEADLPLPGMGQARDRLISGSLGGAIVR